MKTALIVIDVQEGFNMRVEAGDGRNNPEAEMNIAALLDAFRTQEAPIFHIRHASSDPESLFRKGTEGFAVQDFAREFPGEPVIEKSVNSSFIGTTLEQDLRDAGIERLVLCGATTNHCVETTTRMAGNLGFTAWLAREAVWTFEQIGPDGEFHSADEVHQMSLANLHGEFATIVSTLQILGIFV